MNLQDVKKLMELFDNSQIAKFALKQEGFELKLEKPSTHTIQAQSIPQPVPIPQATNENPQSTNTKANDSNALFITSPMVGTFYRAPSPGAAPYINVGDSVKKGQTVGIIEAMKIMNEIEAEFDCKVIAIEVNDGQPVEYASPLIRVEKI